LTGTAFVIPYADGSGTAVGSRITNQTIRAIVVDLAVRWKAKVSLTDITCSALRVAFTTTVFATCLGVHAARASRLWLLSFNGGTNVDSWCGRLL
jgi:hypothetical protein